MPPRANSTTSRNSGPSTICQYSAAREAAAVLGAGERLNVIAGRPLPAGWTGKLWAQIQGIDAATGEAASNATNPSDYLLLTDADIVFAPGALSSLVARAEQDGLVLNSLMVKLRCKSFAERMFVPAFVVFFQMLYPFAWANDPRRSTAAAAGGCMLVRREVLAAAGGLEKIRNARIDDIALARLLKRPPVAARCWLGFSTDVRSRRPYPRFALLWGMVARSASTQLRYSPPLLVAVLAGLAWLYLLPPVAGLAGLALSTRLPASTQERP